jgi:hypothetical protein
MSHVYGTTAIIMPAYEDISSVSVSSWRCAVMARAIIAIPELRQGDHESPAHGRAKTVLPPSSNYRSLKLLPALCDSIGDGNVVTADRRRAMCTHWLQLTHGTLGIGGGRSRRYGIVWGTPVSLQPEPTRMRIFWSENGKRKYCLQQGRTSGDSYVSFRTIALFPFTIALVPSLCKGSPYIFI